MPIEIREPEEEAGRRTLVVTGAEAEKMLLVIQSNAKPNARLLEAIQRTRMARVIQDDV